jgi:hypothetical protein
MRFNNASANTKKSVELNNFLGVDFSSAPTNVSKNRASFAKNLINIDGVNQKRPGWEELLNLGEYSVINGIFINKFERHGHIDEIMLVQVDGVIVRVDYDEKTGTYSKRTIELKNTKSHYSGYDEFVNTNFKSQAFFSKNKLYILGGGEYFVYEPKEHIEGFVSTEEYINKNGDYVTIDKIYNSGDTVEFNGVVYICNTDGTNARLNPPSGLLGVASTGWNYGIDYYELRRVINDKKTYIPTTTIGIMPLQVEDTSRTSLDKVNLLQSYRINKLRGVDGTKNFGTFYCDVYETTRIEGKTYYKNIGITFEEATNVPNELGNTYISSNGYYEQHKGFEYQLDSNVIKQGTPVYIEITTKDGVKKLTNSYADGGHGIIFGDTDYDRFLFDEDGTYCGFLKIDYGKVIFFTDVIDITPEVEIEDNIIVKFIPFHADKTITNCEFGCKFGYKGQDTLFLSGNKQYLNKDFYSYTVEEDFTYFPADNIQTFGSASSAVKAYMHIADGTLAVLKEPFGNEPTIYYRSVNYIIDDIGATKIQYPVTQGAVGEGAINAYTVGALTGDNLFVSENGIFGLTLVDNIVVNERYARERDRFIHSKLIKHDLSNAVATIYQGRYLLAVDNVCYVLDSRYKSTEQQDKDDTFAYESWYWDNIPARCFCVYNNELYFGTNSGGLCKFSKDNYVDITIKDLDVISITPYSDDGLGNYITVWQGFADLIHNGDEVRFNKERLFITEFDGYDSFKLCNASGEVIKLGVYDETPTLYLLIKKPVVSSWQSAVLDLGLYDYSKNLDSLSVVLSPDYHGKVRFGYETKKVTLDLMAKQIKSAETEQSHHFFDFDNIDFDNFTFETAFASSYTKRIRERNINYIMFKAVMDDEKNSALMSIKVDYTIYKKNRGVR